MVLHKCKFCNYSTKLKGNMTTHINKKNKCYEKEIIHDGLKEIIKDDTKTYNEVKEIINVPIKINELENLLEKQIKTIDELTKEKEELQKENDEYYDMIEDRDEAISKLNARVTKYKEKVEKYEDLIRQLAVKEKVIDKHEDKKGMVVNKQVIKFL